MRVSPYDTIDPMQRWSTAAAAIAGGTLDPQGRVKFTIAPGEKIASAGSCFSMRIAERLRALSGDYLSAETAPAWLAPDAAEKYGYVPFSARHGLIFTTAQLEQLFDRAFGTFVPAENAWKVDGGYVDPFRPRISPEPFASVRELEADREQHLAAVRYLFERTDAFVFTMGLTELWRDRRDGAVFPFCPGVAGGAFDANLHEYHNLSFTDNFQSLARFLTALRAVNPKVKVVLTVSPVPIGATIEEQHVVRSTTYTKSVLRAVAEEIARAFDFVDYFAAYEMVSQAFAGGDAFVADRRHIKPEEADRVVEAFCRHYLRGFAERTPAPVTVPVPAIEQILICDEDLFAR